MRIDNAFSLRHYFFTEGFDTLDLREAKASPEDKTKINTEKFNRYFRGSLGIIFVLRITSSREHRTYTFSDGGNGGSL
jgi:hypothetical protein